MFSLNPLSMLFLFLILLGVIPNLFYMTGYLSHIKRKTHFLIHYFTFIFSMTGVVLSNEILPFLFFWELMSLASWQLILTEPTDEAIKAARFYFFMTHFGFVFILLFFLMLGGDSLFTNFETLKELAADFKYPTLLFLLITVGFLSKAGVVPLHVWLPYAHPAAPSPVSALMSGIMLKIAIYAFLRFLFIIPNWQIEWGVIILALGAISSLVGVLYAIASHDIKALLANHSIENIGIILIGIGVGMIFTYLKLPALAAFAFIAAVYHTLNHMSFKSLLFMSAGSVLYATQTKHIESYGGLIKLMPITAFMFLIAAISISALPPTNGFLSEWMIFQSMLSSSGIDNLVLKLSFPFAIFALALTGGLAIACFVKAFGITFLGLARSENAKHAKEVNKLMLTGQILMAGVVISLMLFMPFFIKIINYSLPITDIYHKLFQNIWVMHSLNSNGAVAPLLILAGLIIVVFAIYAFYKYLNPKIRIYHTWACGYNTNAKSQYSATGFAGPIRRFFEWLYRPEVHTHTQTISGHKTKFTSSLYEVHIKPLFEKSLYDNVVKGLNFLSYFVYKLSHFERHRYSSLIFMLLIFALFSFRVFYKEISWGNIVLEVIVMSIFYKFLFGENK
ncbi:proton-conducting transporter membrane subunit [Caminibacter pacificus]|uniref:Hydrogenase n=1 Tax=Caminibacter pacificus TaxID=1424653 RepID=A0AAJ4UXY4_9BACT|nr:proton-conducting transporter membrane subunit [Caminibacter pacificus]QCI27920.1 hydrogenase [Caminibacter pacificus]ROR39902.1 hydrogenase-4 component B [Caminibacter pacificus]